MLNDQKRWREKNPEYMMDYFKRNPEKYKNHLERCKRNSKERYHKDKDFRKKCLKKDAERYKRNK